LYTKRSSWTYTFKQTVHQHVVYLTQSPRCFAFSPRTSLVAALLYTHNDERHVVPLGLAIGELGNLFEDAGDDLL